MANSSFSFGQALNSNVGKRRAINDSNVTVATTDYAINFTTLSSTRTVTLPTPASTGATTTNYVPFIIKDESGTASGSNVINIVVSGGATIDGASSKQIANAYGSIRLYTNGITYFTS